MSFAFKNPSDGWTHLERQIQKEIILSIYCSITDPINKLILMAAYENDYSEQDIADMMGVSQAAISKRLKKTLELVRKLHKIGKL
jgi:DNA-directed RNA polymerase specialized sigma subunit